MKAIKDLFQNDTNQNLKSLMSSDVVGCTTIYHDSGQPMLTVISLSSDADDTDLEDMVFVLDHENNRFYQGSRGEWEQLITERQYKIAT